MDRFTVAEPARVRERCFSRYRLNAQAWEPCLTNTSLRIRFVAHASPAPAPVLALMANLGSHLHLPVLPGLPT